MRIVTRYNKHYEIAFFDQSIETVKAYINNKSKLFSKIGYCFECESIANNCYILKFIPVN